MDPNMIGVLAVTSTLGVGLIAAVFTAFHHITKVLGDRIDDLRDESRHSFGDLRDESRHNFEDLAQRIDALASKLDDHVARSH